MSREFKSLLVLVLSLAFILLIFIGCNRLASHRAEEKFRLAVGLNSGLITSENVQTALLNRFPLDTSKDIILPQLVRSKILPDAVIGTINDSYSVSLPYGSSLWPPCGKAMRVDIHFHPINKSLQSIQTEELRICP